MSSEDSPRPGARAPRGFVDRRGPALQIERRLLAAVSSVYESYGFEALDTGAFEYADALGKFLPDADRPNEGVFALRDDDDQWLALRYDLTAPLARYAAQNWGDLPKPFRRYAVGPVWRNEKPGPGRYRQFIQCDADTVGSDRPEADAEIIAMALAGYAAAGLARGSVTIRINDRNLLNGVLAANDIDHPGQRLAALRAADKLDRLGPGGVADLLGAGRLDESGAFTSGAQLPARAIDAILAFLAAGRGARGPTLDAISTVIGRSQEGDKGLEALARLGAALDRLGVSEDEALIEPSIVRGLEYYTGAVFEAELRPNGVSATDFGAIGGGGRYDDLIARFSGERIPATGFSFGVSRIAAALAMSEAAGPPPRGPVVVLALDPQLMGEYFAMATELRAAGLAAEVYLGVAGMRAQMKYADRRLAPAAVILGEDEFAKGLVTIKDLDLGRVLAVGVRDNAAWREERPGQVTLGRSDLVAEVRRILGAAP